MITLTKNGNAIVFTFEDNAHYLFDGTIEVPINSLTLITDNSQMATFKKSASNDIFISATYAELGMSKADLESWFKENACGSTGGGGVTSGEVETMIEASLEDYYDIDEVDTALANKADTSAVTEAISSAVSGKVNTSAFNTYSAATDARIAEDEEVTAAALNDLQENKADTSAVTAVANDVSTLSGAVEDAGAYYINFATIDRISDDDWNGIVAAIDDHRPIYAGFSMNGGAMLYYGVEYMNKNSGNTEIVMAVSDNESHYFYTFTKNGSNDYSFTVSTKPFVTQAEKTAWNAKQDALSAGTGIEISGNVISCTVSGGGSYVYYTEDTSSESATIKVQNDDGLGNRSDNRVFVDGGDIIIESYNETDDGEGNTGTTDTQVDINSLGLSIIAYSDDGIDTTQTQLEVQPMGAYINSEPIATEPYVNAAVSGKADTSAVTAVANDVSTLSGAVEDAGAYYISFATIATTGIRDEDWDGIVAAIDGHRPIYAGYPRNDGGILYYGVECMNKNSGNTQIVLTASDNSQHYFYTFTKNGSNDYSYTVSTKPYVPDITTAITSGSTDSEIPTAKAVYDAVGQGGGTTYSAGTNISIANDTINCTLPITANTSNKNVTVGYDLNVREEGETSIGKFNINRYVNATVHSGNTIFTVGNGGSNALRHNALEIRKNGDLYFADTSNNDQSYYQKPMVRLQDMYAALGGLKFVQCTQAEYDALVTKDANTLYIISNVVS